MPDDKTKQAQDRKRISLREDYEVRYWTERLGVSREELARAVEDVGPNVDDVAKHIRSLRGH
jgi:hypothetical protein